MMSEADCRAHRQAKLAWYDEHFPRHLIETFESATLSRDAARIVEEKFAE